MNDIPFILNTGEEFAPPALWLETWYSFYSVEYVNRQLRRAAVWTFDNESKRKTKRGMKRFIGAWLSSNWDENSNYKMKELS